MEDSGKRFTLGELSTLVELPQRTVRYYIQRGLIDAPLGVGRGAHYDARHIEQLLEIRKWQNAGVSLERIGDLMKASDDVPVPPVPPRKPGDVSVLSHILVAEGVELTIDPQRAQLSPEQVRALAAGVAKLFEEVVEGSD